jgi:hypothetical protein
MLGSGMPILNTIGSSLFSVGSFGLTAAVNYALSGLIDWTIALLFVVGGNRWRHSRHAFREPHSVKPAHAYLHLCGRRLRRRHRHAGAHRISFLAVNSMRTTMASPSPYRVRVATRLLHRR